MTKEFEARNFALGLISEEYHPLLEKFTDPADFLVAYAGIQHVLLKDAEERANTDWLTSFATSEVWHANLRERLESNRNNTAVIAIDLTNFKKVNDALGQTSGNQLLKQFSDKLHNLRMIEADTFGRLGGDEFGIIIDLTPREEYGEKLSREERLSVVMSRLQDSINELHDDRPDLRKEFGFDIAIGAALATAIDNDTSLFRAAEKQMKAMKAEQHDEFGAYR